MSSTTDARQAAHEADRRILQVLLDGMAADTVGGLNWPGVARLVRRALLGAGVDEALRLLDETAGWDIYAGSDDVKHFVADLRSRLRATALRVPADPVQLDRLLAEWARTDCPRQHPHAGPCNGTLGRFGLRWMHDEVVQR